MMSMSTPATQAPVGQSNGDTAAPTLGQWADLPPAEKKNGPNSKFAPELNATAREQAENMDETGKPRARVISVQKSPRSASGRSSTIKRKLREGKVNGLEFPADQFEIVPRGSVVYAIYHMPKADTPKADAPKAAASKSDAPRQATPDPKAKSGKPVRK